MLTLFKELFIWWNRQTIGTRIDTFLFGKLVGKDYLGNTYTAKYNRTSEMDSGTGFYIYIDDKGPWKKRIGKRCDYAIIYVDDAYFTTDKCKIEN